MIGGTRIGIRIGKDWRNSSIIKSVREDGNVIKIKMEIWFIDTKTPKRLYDSE